MDFTQLLKQMNQNVPIGNGNILQLHQKINALGGGDIEFYKLYLLEKKYWRNLFGIEGDDELAEIFPSIVQGAWENGIVGYRAYGDQIDKSVIFAMNKRKTNGVGLTISGSGIPIQYNLSQQTSIKESKKLTKENTIFLQLGADAFPGLFWYMSFLTKLKGLLSATYTNSLFKVKKLKYEVNNNDSEIASMEMNSMLDPESPYFKVITQPVGAMNSDASKKASPNNIEIVNKGSNADGDLWSDIKELEKFWYKRFGRRMNLSSKKQRVNGGEISEESKNFDILESEMKMNLQMFVKKFNKKYNRNAKLVINYEEQENKHTKESGNPEGKVENNE